VKIRFFPDKIHAFPKSTIVDVEEALTDFLENGSSNALRQEQHRRRRSL
jgi:hypothetical protein